MNEGAPIPLRVLQPIASAGIGKSTVMVILIAAMVVGVGTWFVAGTAREAWDSAAARENYDETHTTELKVAPSVTGWKFNLNGLITDSRSGSDGNWPMSPRSYMKTYFYDTNDRDVGLGSVTPGATPIEEASYVDEIVNNIKDPEFPGLMERKAIKCWTKNNPIMPPKSGNPNIHLRENELKITFTVQYVTPKGDVDDTATKSCSFKTTIYYHKIDPGSVGTSYYGPYKTSYSNTYLYVPFNVQLRYNMLVMYAQGETEQITWEDEFGPNYKELNHLGPQPLTLETPHYPQGSQGVEQPVKYTFPLDYEIDVGVVGGGLQ